MELKIRGGIVLIDECDYELVSGLSWYVENNGYARWKGKRNQGSAKMHRLIMGAKTGQIVDHINGNPLDNRRSNLRFCTQKQNTRNVRKLDSNTTGFKGVYWRKNRRKFNAHIMVDYKLMYLGSFDTAEDAARCYDEAAVKHFGAFARLNFPQLSQ